MPSPDVKPASSLGPEYLPTLTQKELGGRISMLGIKKANTRSWQLFILGILAGLYIGLGGQVFLVALDQGAGKIVGGAVFSVGLVLVIVAGAELFTGNIILVVGTMTGLISLRKTLRNWSTVYLANFLGAYGLAMLIWSTGLLGSRGALNSLGELAVKVADGKLALTFGEAFTRGILCNILVILAIIMATMSKDIISKITCCVLPIMTFVACGFEHCVANMYLIPLGMFAEGLPLGGQLAMWDNLIPVTLGNCVGGIFILAIHPNRIRQLVYLWQHRRETPDSVPGPPSEG
ncbi:MAG: formate/nitrite transporter family protein [Victivallales bacterium]|jgi:formate transporter|nr:formate/nitrite transporter family protein [Victivallales bacterium]MBT7162417.1 formate/nitrite transporter family protein [Victivallales bacterium]